MQQPLGQAWDSCNGCVLNAGRADSGSPPHRPACNRQSRCLSAVEEHSVPAVQKQGWCTATPGSQPAVGSGASAEMLTAMRKHTLKESE